MTDLGGYRALPTAEDYDLWLRFLKTGHQIGATNQQLMQYRLRGNSMTQGDRFKVFLVTQYLQAAYRRDQYPDADTEATEIQAYLKAHGAMDKQKADRFSQRVINLSAGKKALQQNMFSKQSASLCRCCWIKMFARMRNSHVNLMPFTRN